MHASFARDAAHIGLFLHFRAHSVRKLRDGGLRSDFLHHQGGCDAYTRPAHAVLAYSPLDARMITPNMRNFSYLDRAALACMRTSAFHTLSIAVTPMFSAPHCAQTARQAVHARQTAPQYK